MIDKHNNNMDDDKYTIADQDYMPCYQPVPRSMIKPKPNNQESQPVLLQDTSSSTSRSIYEDNNLISSQSIRILKENE